MASLKEVKTRISSVVSTQQITKAMKMVAAAKLRRSQERIWQMRPFAKQMMTILQNLSSANTDGDSWYSKARPEEKILIVTISSDRGLCGSFNSNIFKGVLRMIQEKYAMQQAKGNVTILAIGKKGFEYFSKRKFPVVGDYVNIFHNLSFEKVSEASQFIMDSFRGGRYDKVEIVYNVFKNVATQILTMEQLLPVMPLPASAKKQEIDYIFQPNQEEILSGLIPKSLNVQVYIACEDAFNSLLKNSF